MSDNKIRRFATRSLKDVPLSYENEDGDRVTEKFTVVYRSYSRKVHNEMASQNADADGRVPFSVMLAQVVVSITDRDGKPLTDDRGMQADFAAGFFDTIHVDEAKALYDRINEDMFPPKASPEPGPSGSNPAASEA